MNAYTVLARRYRSQGFDQVVGQEVIATTLSRAIAVNRVAHAYLFTGTRGVGKTSMARLLARALNAPDSLADCPKPPGADFPAVEVQQRMAEAIMRGDDLNVVEIDGASNNSVDQARQLRTNAALSPTDNARYKIYIIDEVHMLSTAAFNALLKTMEEPPSHVKFILCTTESHKVPATIQSRCQRFDFRNIPTARIAAHLKHVLDNEKVSADEQVVWQLARLGNGSMRDALSLLDRLIAAGEQPLALQTLEQLLGLPPQQLVIELVDALAVGDVGASIQQSAKLLQVGIAQEQLADVLIERLRQLMLISACGTDSELVELSDDAITIAAEQAKKFDTASLVYMIALCENMQRFAKNSSNPRALLDATIVRLALAEKMADVAALLAHSDTMTKPVANTAAPKKKEQVALVPEPAPLPAGRQPDVQEVWSHLLAKADAKAALSWIRSIKVRKLEYDVLHLGIEPGRSDLAKFVGARQKQQLVDLLVPIVGRPIRIEIEPPSAEPVTELVNHLEPQGPLDSDQRSTALGLPLVKMVTNQFDVSVIEVRPEQQTNDETLNVEDPPS